MGHPIRSLVEKFREAFSEAYANDEISFRHIYSVVNRFENIRSVANNKLPGIPGLLMKRLRKIFAILLKTTLRKSFVS